MHQTEASTVPGKHHHQLLHEILDFIRPYPMVVEVAYLAAWQQSKVKGGEELHCLLGASRPSGPAALESPLAANGTQPSQEPRWTMRIRRCAKLVSRPQPCLKILNPLLRERVKMHKAKVAQALATMLLLRPSGLSCKVAAKAASPRDKVQ